MQVTETKYYSGQDFKEYLQMPGVSFSSLKDTPVPQTVGLSLGTRVHNYLLEPEKYDWQQPEIVKPIAAELRKVVGEAYKYMHTEVAFTANFHHNGLTMPYKGRADMMKAGTIVIDFKVLSCSIQQGIERFGYDNQISGYCLATGSQVGLIIAYNKAKKQIETKRIIPSADFWEYHVVRLGEVVAHTI